MNLCYIKEVEKMEELLSKGQRKLPYILKYLTYKIKYIFKILGVEEINTKSIYTIPIYDVKRKTIKENQIKTTKVLKKVIKYLEKNNINKVVLSKYLQEKKEIKDFLYSQNIHILDGRWLFQVVLKECLDYIESKTKKPLKEQEVSILVNDNNQMNMDTIVLFTEKIKKLKIITNRMDRFKALEENLYNQYGITISVMNNKKKSLLKSDIIINLDFPEELINKYKMNEHAMLMNVQEKISIHSKMFLGVNVNYYNIRLNKETIQWFKQLNLYSKFDPNILYESILYQKDKLENIRKKVIKDDIKILWLIGNNGIIQEREYNLEPMKKNT